MPPFSFGASASPTQAPAGPVPPAGGNNDFLAALMKMLQQQPQQQQAPVDFASLFSSVRNDPQGDANRAYVPGATSGAGSPFTNGFFNNSAADLSPEARAATQGRSASTQWAQMGQNSNVDPAKLAGLFSQMTPIPHPYESTEASPVSDPYFAGRMEHMFGPGFQVPQAQTPEVRRATPVGPGGPYNANTNPQLPPEAVAGDGTTSYRRKKPGMAGSPQPGFNFPQLFR